MFIYSTLKSNLPLTTMQVLKSNTKSNFGKLKLISKAFLSSPNPVHDKYIERMDLINPQSTEEKINEKLLNYALGAIEIS